MTIRTFRECFSEVTCISWLIQLGSRPPSVRNLLTMMTSEGGGDRNRLTELICLVVIRRLSCCSLSLSVSNV